MKHQYRLLKTSPWWRYISYVIAFAVLLPVITVFTSWLIPGHENWQHLSQHLLQRLLVNSVVLLLGVTFTTAILGVSLAWLVTQYDFPGRSWFSKLLLFPLALPAYVTGFVYIGLLDYSGPVMSRLRDWGWPESLVPEVRSTWGVIAVLSLALYPYVYLIVKGAFESQGRQMIEAARSLGKSMPRIFYSLAIPMALPWLLGAISLVGMETLADFGTVSIFVYDTFTTAIYRSWYGLFSPETAAQLASLLIIPISLFYLLEQWIKKRQNYDTLLVMPNRQLKIPRAWSWLASLFCLLMISVALLIPMAQLVVWAIDEMQRADWVRTLQITANSAILAMITAVSVCSCAWTLIFAYRFFKAPKLFFANRLATVGYALPGSVLAIGVFLPLTWVDRGLGWVMEHWFNQEIGLWLTGSAFAMVAGLTIRFLAVAHAAIFTGQQRISAKLDEAAVNHGVYGLKQMWLVHLPLMRTPLLTAFILVFVDVVKEMPLTLMTRPFGWDTLSVRIFEFIGEGEWQRASLPAIILVFVSMIPVLILDRKKG
ncbi:MAG: ABC transporter permease [Oligoflexus sp.]